MYKTTNKNTQQGRIAQFAYLWKIPVPTLKTSLICETTYGGNKIQETSSLGWLIQFTSIILKKASFILSLVLTTSLTTISSFSHKILRCFLQTCSTNFNTSITTSLTHFSSLKGLHAFSKIYRHAFTRNTINNIFWF